MLFTYVSVNDILKRAHDRFADLHKDIFPRAEIEIFY